MTPLLPVLASLTLGVDLIDALSQTDLVGILCIALLLFLSIRSGYFIFQKFYEIRTATNESEDFIAECLEGRKTLPEIYSASKEYPNSPLAALLREAYIECEMEMRQDFIRELPLDQRLALGKASVATALERTAASELRKLENRLVHLATASTLAPFIGLFGTVWGVLGSFQALGREGAAALTTLAPGISTALTTTVFGLLVAIPAAAMYNYLTSQVTRLGSRMDSFGHELTSVFQRHLLRRG